jgi:hypothetical protein
MNLVMYYSLFNYRFKLLFLKLKSFSASMKFSDFKKDATKGFIVTNI